MLINVIIEIVYAKGDGSHCISVKSQTRRGFCL